MSKIFFTKFILFFISNPDAEKKIPKAFITFEIFFIISILMILKKSNFHKYFCLLFYTPGS